MIIMSAQQLRPAPRIAPLAALDAARKFPVFGPVFNDYPFGGFLIFNGVKTFVDGRTELYLKGLLERTWYAEHGSSDTAFLSLLDEYHVTWALLVNGSPGVEKLRGSKQWTEIYRDVYSVVFARI
jgi:hypothetical protein